jgi:hypothetical protein
MSEIPNIGANNIPNINNLGGPSIIPIINPPVVQQAPQSLIRSLEVPIVRYTDTSIKYPTLSVPTQAEFDEAVRAERKALEEERQEKSRGLPDTPVIPPQVLVPTPPTNKDSVRQTPPVELLKSNLGVPTIEVPIIGEVPIPPKEQVLLAGTTATASVAAALIGKSMVEWMVKKMKPIINQLFVRGKKLLNKDLTDYELQVFFAFEKETQMKKVVKLLKKEQKAEKLRQFKEFHDK